MGDIYLATDETLGREVVVKVLSDRYAADPAITERFKREGLAAARLSGESGAVTIFDVGDWRGRPFIVMEHLGGGSLEDRLGREGAQPPDRALRWLGQAAETLDSAHRHGIVHRDVKPANLLLDDRDDLHVADFGIASAAGLDSMTLTGTILGTAGYLSPEQARGERAGPSSDLYALAVVAYELLSGHRPYENDSPTAEAAAHVNAPVPSIAERSKNLPPALDGVFRRALAKDPAARYGSAAELVSALKEALSEPARDDRLAPPPRHRPRRSGLPARFLIPAALLLGAAAVGAAVAAILTSGGDPTGAGAHPHRRGPRGNDDGSPDGHAADRASASATPPPPPPRRGERHRRAHAQRPRLLAVAARRLLQARSRSCSKPSRSSAAQAPVTHTRATPTTTSATPSTGWAAARRRSRTSSRAEQLEPDRHEPRQILKRAERC